MNRSGPPGPTPLRSTGALLLEREDELRLVDEVLDAGRSGNGGLLLVRGAPGVGKTGLLQAAVQGAFEADMSVLRVRGAELEQRFAWGTVHELFATTIDARDPASGRPLLSGAAALAAPVLIDGATGDGDGDAPRTRSPGPPAEARFAVAHGLYWHLADLAEETPIAVVVDDAHWVDVASLHFLLHLAGRLDGLPVALVVAARTQADRERDVLLDQLAAAPDARCCSPAPLSAAGVETLLDRELGAAAARWLGAVCHRQAGGNPFLTSELINELRRSGVPASAAGAEMVAQLQPSRVTRSVSARLSVLGSEATDLARAVAVLGAPAEARLAAAVARQDLERATLQADGLARSGILSPARPLDFVHPLVETAVRDEIAAGERALLHRRAFEALVADGADPRSSASHLLHTEPDGDDETVRLLRVAAAAAVDRGDPDTAIALLDRARRESVAAGEDPELLEDLGRVQLAAGDPAGIDRLELARGTQRDPRRRAGLDLTVAVARYERGEASAAKATLARGLAEELPEDDEIRVSLQAADLTVTRSLLQAPVPDEEAAAATLARHGNGRTPVERLTLAQLAFQGLQTGELPYRTVAELARHAVPPLHGEGIDTLDRLALPLAGMSLYFSDAGEAAEVAFSAEIDRSQLQGARMAFATASFFRGVARFLRGRLIGAIDDWQVAIDAARDGWAFALPSSRALRALVALDRDELELADELLALPGGDEPWTPHPTFPYVLATRGVRATADGRPQEGLELLLRCGERQEALGIRNPSVMHWQAEAALAAFAAGDESRARDLARELLRRTERYEAPRALGIARRTAGLVGEGDPDGLLTGSVHVLERSEGELELARSLLELGAWQRRAGQRTTSRETLRRAIDVAERCGASALSRRGSDELRVAGGRPRRLRISGSDALTSSERRVADLAAEGLTNRQIAQRLFVTLRTVETHLTHVYGKLDVDRAGLAEAMAGGAHT